MPTISLWQEKGFGKKGDKLHPGWNPVFELKTGSKPDTWSRLSPELDSDTTDNVYTVRLPWTHGDVRTSADQCKPRVIYTSQFSAHEVLLPKA